MIRLFTLLPALFAFRLAFAIDQAEAPVETVGVGGIIAFFLVCIVLVVAFVMLTNKASKKAAESQARKEH